MCLYTNIAVVPYYKSLCSVAKYPVKGTWISHSRSKMYFKISKAGVGVYQDNLSYTGVLQRHGGSEKEMQPERSDTVYLFRWHCKFCLSYNWSYKKPYDPQVLRWRHLFVFSKRRQNVLYCEICISLRITQVTSTGYTQGTYSFPASAINSEWAVDLILQEGKTNIQ